MTKTMKWERIKILVDRSIDKDNSGYLDRWVGELADQFISRL